MPLFSPGRGGLSASLLKFIACVFMFLDHLGLMLFPDLLFLRILGRFAFPIFAFFIAEGCRYTKAPVRRFFSVFLLGILCEIGQILFTGGWYGNILLTFSCSILLISLLQAWKRSLCGEDRLRQFLLFALFFTVCAVLGVLISRIGVDYGFPGVMLPVLISVFDWRRGESPDVLKRLDTLPVRLCLTFLGLLLVALQPSVHSIQYFSLLTPVLLAFYNGKPGNRRFKYGFYVFYPAHMVLLAGLQWLLF